MPGPDCATKELRLHPDPGRAGVAARSAGARLWRPVERQRQRQAISTVPTRVPVLTCAMAIVLLKQGRDIEASALGGRDQLKQRAQLLSVQCVEPVKIVLANACQQPHHHRQVSGTDGACGAGMWLWHRGSPVSGMSPICATFHRSCQSCKITQTAEPRQTARPAEHAQTANPAPRSGRRDASLRDQNPGSEKKRGSEPAKKPAMSQPAFRMGLPRYRPQAARPLAAAFRAFLTSARTCQTQSRARRKALVCSPGDPFPGPPRPADPALREPRCASTFLNMS